MENNKIFKGLDFILLRLSFDFYKVVWFLAVHFFDEKTPEWVTILSSPASPCVLSGRAEAMSIV